MFIFCCGVFEHECVSHAICGGAVVCERVGEITLAALKQNKKKQLQTPESQIFAHTAVTEKVKAHTSLDLH